jgi:hypothetical protein
LTVESADGLLRRLAICVLHERETARASRLAVERPHDLRGLTDNAEMRAKVVFSGLVGKVSDEQSN